jgi:eukaryotic-like serine/threonine-protein kinase
VAGSIRCSRCGRELGDGVQVCSYGGACSADVSKQAETGPIDGALAGLKIGNYLVKELIGAGGMGEVYAGEQLVIHKPVAIKVLKRAATRDDTASARMLQEARAVGAIGHRGVVDIFDFGTLHDGRPYLVMERLDGRRLDRVMRGHPRLSEKQIVKLLSDICTPLAAVHARGIVHRDLKPENVFVMTDAATGEDYVKLLDFGLAKNRLAPIGTGPTTREGFVVGTPDYIAPEQARGTGISPRSDLYSLGIVAFEMLTRRLPFSAGSPADMMTRHVHAPVPRVSTLEPTVSKWLDDLVFSLMAKREEDRPQSAEGLRRMLLEGKPALGDSGDLPITTVVTAPDPTSGSGLHSRPTLDQVEEVITQTGAAGGSRSSLTLANIRHHLWKYRRLAVAVTVGAGVLGALLYRLSH